MKHSRRYDSVIEALHKSRQLCPNCGLRFNDLTGAKYQQHLDWHFRENLKSSDKSRCREWYISLEVTVFSIFHSFIFLLTVSFFSVFSVDWQFLIEVMVLGLARI